MITVRKTVAKEVMSSSVVKVNGHVVPDCFATSTKCTKDKETRNEMIYITSCNSLSMAA